jgi:hypothetical protein
MIHRGCTMPHRSAVFLCLAVAALGLAGCALAPPPYPAPAVWGQHHWGSFPVQPPDYSPDYTYVPVVARDGRTRMVLVPKACLVADPTQLPALGPLAPPGCANAYNLLRMAERKADLVRGRPLGAAPAAPTARAAQEYIYGAKGTQGTLGGGLPRVPGSPAQGAGAESETEKPPATR